MTGELHRCGFCDQFDVDPTEPVIIRSSLCGQLAAFGWGWHESGDKPVLICRPCVDLDPEIAERLAAQPAHARIVDVDAATAMRDRASPNELTDPPGVRRSP